MIIDGVVVWCVLSVVVVLVVVGKIAKEKEELHQQAVGYVVESLEGYNLHKDYKEELISLYYTYLVTEDLGILDDFNSKYNTYTGVTYSSSS